MSPLEHHPPVMVNEFGNWTGAGTHYRRFPQRRYGLLLACGLTLLVFGAGFLFLELRGPDSGETSARQASGLKLTVPEMKRVEGVLVSTAPAQDGSALRRGPVRLAGTGMPSQRESNVYISGHRLGYPGTGSFLLFRDLNHLRGGDRIVLRDGEGRSYIYQVFDRRVVGPGNLSVTEPFEGRNVVSLQTCTLPDYRQRLVVRAELVDTRRA